MHAVLVNVGDELGGLAHLVPVAIHEDHDLLAELAVVYVVHGHDHVVDKAAATVVHVPEAGGLGVQELLGGIEVQVGRGAAELDAAEAAELGARVGHAGLGERGQHWVLEVLGAG